MKSARELRLLGATEEAACVAIRDLLEQRGSRTALLTDLAIAGWYVPGLRSLAELACDAALTDLQTTDEDRRNALVNARWFIEPLTHHFQPEEIKIPTEYLRDRALNQQWFPCNPCVFNSSTKTLIRLVNYEQSLGRVYKSTSLDGVIRTRYLLLSTNGFEQLKEDPATLWWHPKSLIRGLEDIRVVEYRRNFLYTATSCQVPNAEKSTYGDWRAPRVVWGDLDVIEPKVLSTIPLTYGQQSSEKNWIPFVQNSELFLVYSWDPFTVISPNKTGIECARHPTSENNFHAKGWRGGTQGIDWNPHTTLGLIHEVARLETRNVYLHRFVEWNNRTILRYSRPFIFDTACIEYACGISMVSNLDDVTISYGVEDKEAWLIRIPAKWIGSQLFSKSEHQRALNSELERHSRHT